MGGGEVSAEILREAARLMRERAEAAIHEADGATTWRLGPEAWDGNVSTVEVLTPNDPDPFDVAENCSDDDARHIASWRPAVALAVADWLDATADLGELLDYDGSGQPGSPHHAANAVARAYLGDP